MCFTIIFLLNISGTPLQQAEKSKNYDLPELVDIDLAWVQPIRDDG